MRHFLIVPLCLFPLWAVAAPLATVNGTAITPAMLAAANPSAATQPAVRQETLQTIIARTLLAQEAQKQGWDKAPPVKAALQVQHTDLLANVAAQHYWAKHPISPEALEKAYHKALTTLPKQEYRSRYILVPTETEAEDILKKLAHGASFSLLAERHSTADNAALGGEAGWIAGTAVPAPFLAALQGRKDQEVSGPISTPQGFAIVQKLGQRAFPRPSLAAVKGQLETALRNQSLSQYVKTLKKDAHIDITKERSHATH